MKINIKLNDSFKGAFKSSKRHLVLYGGAGSGKSKFVAQKVVLDMLSDGRYKWLCVRKTGKSLKNSVFEEIRKVISENELSKLFKLNKTNMTIRCVNGARIITSGLDDSEKLKSIEGINRIWIEEANEVTEQDYLQLDLRMRGKQNSIGKAGFQMVLTFNPISELHWLKKKFIDVGIENSYILKTTYKDNPFLDRNYIKTLLELKDQDYQYYKIYCLGEWGSLGNLVFSNWEKQDLSDRMDSFDNIYNAIDWGFSSDPTAYVRVHLNKDRKELYILDELYLRERHIDDIAEELKQIGINREIITCDSAEPRSIADLVRKGFNAVGADKGKGSLSHGIKWLQGYKIIVHESCTNMMNELSTYKWREDSDGNKLPKPLDKNNHLIDALRYALEAEMEKQGQWGW